jgi:hypothetical protein
LKCKVYSLELFVAAAFMISASNALGDNSAAADSVPQCPAVASTAPWDLHPLTGYEDARSENTCTTSPLSSAHGFDSASGTASVSGGDTFAPALVVSLTSGWPPIRVQAGAIDLSPDLEPK